MPNSRASYKSQIRYQLQDFKVVSSVVAISHKGLVSRQEVVDMVVSTKYII